MKITMSHLTSKLFSALLTLFLVFPNVLTGRRQQPSHWVDPDSHLIQTQESRLHQESWVDPDNVGRNAPPKCANNDAAYIASLMEVEDMLHTCKTTLQTLQTSAPTTTTPASVDERANNERATTMRNVEILYARRFIGILLEVASLRGAQLELGERRQTSINVDIGVDELKTLREFVDDGAAVTLEEVNEVLSNVLAASDSGYYAPLPWLDRVKQRFTEGEFQTWSHLTPHALSLFIVTMVMYRRRLGEIAVTFLVVVFALGYQSTYHHMLKMAQIEHMVAQHKYDSIPLSCRASASYSLSDRFVRWLDGEKDDCKKYFMAQHMPPEMSVSATLVLSEMLSTMLVHPLAKLGDGVGKFTAGVLGSLSFWQGIVYFPLILVLLLGSGIVLVVVLSGGRIRMPFYLGGAELSGSSSYTRRRSSSSHAVTSGPGNLEERIRAISREELLVHRIVQQLSPLSNQTQTESVSTIVERFQTMEISDSQRVERLDIGEAKIVSNVPQTSEVRTLVEEIVTVGSSIDILEPVKVSILNKVNIESNSVSVENVSATSSEGDSVLRVEACLVDATNEGFLDSLQKILSETESTSDDRTEGNVTSGNSEFMTSIELIMMDSSAEEATPSRKSSRDSSEGSGDFVKL